MFYLHINSASIKNYNLSILFDIRQILNSDDPPEMSVDMIDRRLDDFMLQFQVLYNLLTIKDRW